MATLAERAAAQDAYLDHRRNCQYCHTHSRELCEQGQRLLLAYEAVTRELYSQLEPRWPPDPA